MPTMGERFGGAEPPSDETIMPPPGVVNLGFTDLTEFPAGAYALLTSHLIPVPPSLVVRAA
jgi:hypothetical protein